MIVIVLVIFLMIDFRVFSEAGNEHEQDYDHEHVGASSLRQAPEVRHYMLE
jgi:hypothetical protein